LLAGWDTWFLWELKRLLISLCCTWSACPTYDWCSKVRVDACAWSSQNCWW
jgi:hypothetical protein